METEHHPQSCSCSIRTLERSFLDFFPIMVHVLFIRHEVFHETACIPILCSQVGKVGIGAPIWRGQVIHQLEYTLALRLRPSCWSLIPTFPQDKILLDGNVDFTLVLDSCRFPSSSHPRITYIHPLYESHSAGSDNAARIAAGTN